MSSHDHYDKIFHLLEAHHKWFQQTIPLIASENVASMAVKEALISDFGNRYAEGWPGERVYAGCIYMDQVETLCIELAKKLFNAEFADVRPVSGAVANLVIYTAFVDPNDRVMVLSIPCGGHITAGKKELGGTAGTVRGLRMEYFPYNYEELNIDVDATKKKVKEMVNEKDPPRMAMFGGSVLPFPQPVKELSEVFVDINAKVVYDAAHVIGLIAGKCFQDPLREGCDAVTVSTHKTLPGPQHGMVLSWKKYAEIIKRATFPGLVSNHHLHSVAGVAVALAEMAEFGKDYANRVIENAKALGQALFERGIDVLGEKKGFTESHVLWVDITKYGDGATVEQNLEKANIIVNRNLLPWDIKMGRHFQHPGGIRLGASEITRLGMGKSEMVEIAEFMKQVIVDKKDLGQVKSSVSEFRKKFQKLHYCFDNIKDAYEYVKIR